MDFDFFKDFERVGTIKLGSELTGKIINLDSFQEFEFFDLKFPEGHEDAGNITEAYNLEKKRYEFAKDISKLIIDECTKIINDIKHKKVDEFDLPTNPQVLANLLELVLDTQANSFTMG